MATTVEALPSRVPGEDTPKVVSEAPEAAPPSTDWDKLRESLESTDSSTTDRSEESGDVETSVEVASEPVVEAAGATAVSTSVEVDVDSIFTKASSRKGFKLGERIERAKTMQEARSRERQKSAIAAEQALDHQRSELKTAKEARADARLSHNRFTQYGKKWELVGEKMRALEQDDRYKSANAFAKRSLRRQAIKDAASEARSWRSDERERVRQAVKDARGEISKAKAAKRDLSRYRRKGGTNSFRENFRMAKGGFGIGEYSAYDGMTDEQKKKLKERMNSRLGKTRNDRHDPRGRRSTRRAADS